MQPRTESTSPLEDRLSKTLLADLIEREATDYLSIEIIREPSDFAKTVRFRRTPVEEVMTTKFVRESARSVPIEDRGTYQFVKHSEPYERVDIKEEPLHSEPYERIDIKESVPVVQIDVWESGEFISSSHLLPIDEPDPEELVACSNLVAIDLEPGDTLVDIETAAGPAALVPTPTWLRPLLVIAFLLGVFAIGVGVPFLLS